MSQENFVKPLAVIDETPLQKKTPTNTTSSNDTAMHEKKLEQLTKTKPVRPLSAYNIFFQLQREHILQGNEGSLATANKEDIIRVIEKRCKSKESDAPKRKHCRTHGKIGFTDLARKIAGAWKTLDKEKKAKFQDFAEKEKKIYNEKMAVWRNEKAKIVEAQAECRFKEFLRTSNVTPSNSQSLPEETVPCGMGGYESMGYAEGIDHCVEDEMYPMYHEQPMFPDTRSRFNEALDMVGEAFDMTKSMIGYQDFDDCNYYDAEGQPPFTFGNMAPMMAMKQPSRQCFPNTAMQRYVSNFEQTPQYHEENFDDDFAVWEMLAQQEAQYSAMTSFPVRGHGMPRKVSLQGQVGGTFATRARAPYRFTTAWKAPPEDAGIYYDVVEDSF